MKKFIILVALLLVASCSTPPPMDSYSTGDINHIVVKVKQMKAEEANDPQVKHCTAKIEVFEKERKHKKIEFKDMLPMKNGPFGVMALEKYFPKHHVIIKQGDYDGRTILIDGYGKVTNMKGGNRYVRYNDKVYVYFDSNLLGYSVFNLTTNKEENSNVDVDRPFQFVKCTDNENLLLRVGRLTYEVETGKEILLKKGQSCSLVPVKNFVQEWKNCIKYN